MPLHQQLRGFLATLADAFTSRVDLASAEFEDLILRLGAALALFVAGMLLAVAALLFLGLAVILAVPDAYRWIPALAFMVFFALGALACGLWLRKSLREMPAPFASTRDVLHRDVEALRPILEPAAASPDSTTTPAEPAPAMAQTVP
jgi:uncharacterized membrane protein YqjE